MIEKNLEVAADSYTKIIDRANANRVRLQRAARIEAEFPGLSQGAVDELRGSIMGALPSEEFHAEVAASVRGVVSLTRGTGTNQPAYVLLTSKGGTAYYFFVTDAGVLRVHTSAPAADTDCSAV